MVYSDDGTRLDHTKGWNVSRCWRFTPGLPCIFLTPQWQCAPAPGWLLAHVGWVLNVHILHLLAAKFVLLPLLSSHLSSQR